MSLLFDGSPAHARLPFLPFAGDVRKSAQVFADPAVKHAWFQEAFAWYKAHAGKVLCRFSGFWFSSLRSESTVFIGMGLSALCRQGA
ncbi:MULTISPECIES: hypothetical protein [unclassified Delftia]|uniref:hypothetical protein n=1 Tax=unclassified Delftia TaxID=2613839 RepID=UPI001901A504|nr:MULTISPECIES: hypothetical protein [unclassified Delftia]MBK0115501.1 hypothetical protein [Delftia sp. S65]MBK0121261.1 hypothetical protein [Delftia sp. S67]MBK0132880.1 hypothetical protein [Delftia sp. S66]